MAFQCVFGRSRALIQRGLTRTDEIRIRTKQKGVNVNYFAYQPSTDERKETQKVKKLGSIWPDEFQRPFKTREEIRLMRKDDPVEFDKMKSAAFRAASNDSAFYASVLLNDDFLVKFRNLVMRKGRKEHTDRILMEAFRLIKAKQAAKWRSRPTVIVDPKILLRMAVENARPLMNIIRKQVGGVVYTIPVAITQERSVFEGMRWIIKEAEDRPRVGIAKRDGLQIQTLAEKLAEVIVETSNYSGKVIAKKHEHHRICEQNRAYAHYAHSKK